MCFAVLIPCMIFSVGLPPLRSLRAHWIEQAASGSTRRTRCRHWQVYVRFCCDYHLPVFPCTLLQASDYISFLWVFMKRSSVITYFHAVIFMHKLPGFCAPSLSEPLLKTVLNGILNKPEGHTVCKDPLTPSHLIRMYNVVDLSMHAGKLTWITLLVMFRALLRISHVIPPSQSLLCSDVCFTDWRVILAVRSAKNRKKCLKPVEIPIYKCENECLFVVGWLRHLFALHP